MQLSHYVFGNFQGSGKCLLRQGAYIVLEWGEGHQLS
jgi:hypothetical protein